MDPSSPKRHQGARLEVVSTSQGEKESTMKLIRVGVDLAKAVFQVHGVDRNVIMGAWLYIGIFNSTLLKA
jgi:hypothetical protein